jgi:uncharacterized iron-regulated protein
MTDDRIWRIGAALAVAAGALALGGCASSGDAPDDKVDAAPLDPRAVAVFDGITGSASEWGAMVDAAAAADVVIIGEIHGHERGLPAAAALWEDLVAGAGGSPALSLEFFERDEQAGLDDYLTGLTDEDGFREATGRTDRNYPDGHRAMVETAREAGLRVYASNAPRRYPTLARTEGYDELTGLRPSQAALFVSPAMPPMGPYRDRFFDVFRGMMESHGGAEQDPDELEAQIEGFYRAQSVWDATMADSIAGAIAEGHRPVVQVVGRFHSDHRGGLVEALWRAAPGMRVVTVSMVESPDFEGEDLGRADFVLEVGASGE